MIKNIFFICESCDSFNFLSKIKLKKHNIVKCDHCGIENYFRRNEEYIYILDSEYSDLLKLGFTTRTPFERLKEINSATGAIDWNVALHYKTFNGKKMEELLFNKFDKNRIANKEQFDIKLAGLVKDIHKAFKIIPNYVREDLESVKNLENRYLYGKMFIYVFDNRQNTNLKIGYSREKPSNKIQEKLFSEKSNGLKLNHENWNLAFYYSLNYEKGFGNKVLESIKRHEISRGEYDISIDNFVKILKNQFGIVPTKVRKDFKKLAKIAKKSK